MKTKFIFLLIIVFAIMNCKKNDDEQVNDSSKITTLDITNITYTSAISGGKITNDGGETIISRGICYSKNPNPTTTDSITIDGAGIGTYTCNLNNLSANTTYYVRAYFTNNNGTIYGNQKQFTTLPLPIETVLVRGGIFLMGQNENSCDPQHNVEVDDFLISKYEITNLQFVNFLNAIGADSDGSVNGGPRYIVSGQYYGISYVGGQFVTDNGKENYPARNVTWYGAKAFSEYYGGKLPTEAEWEFAARGGNSSNGYRYSGSNNIDNVAWYYFNSTSLGYYYPSIVGTKAPNELGIYDMSGNVKEWCNDWFDCDYYNNSPSSNPQGPSWGTDRVVRGGCYESGWQECRVGQRDHLPPDSFCGFRPVFTP